VRRKVGVWEGYTCDLLATWPCGRPGISHVLLLRASLLRVEGGGGGRGREVSSTLYHYCLQVQLFGAVIFAFLFKRNCVFIV